MERKKHKKNMKTILISFALAALLIMAALAAIHTYVRYAYKNRIITPEQASEQNVDCILILGAGVWGSGPSPMLEDRLLQGIELYWAGASDRLLMSGDHGSDDYDEVNTMKTFAMERDVPSEHIFMDHAGFSTYESMYRARDIFKVKKTVVVTQEFHLYRALYIANKLGLDAYGVASNPRAYAGQEYREIREMLARIKDFFTVLFQPEPTYLGEPIPIDGDGNVTND
ncbi:MAG: SanA/YdcF family protein [Caldicoprobacterales bacterium]|jgi:SanA protein